MTHQRLTITISVAWWLAPYLWCLVFVSVLSRREPDWAKLERVIARAIRLRVAS
jgi:hypothetical protein